MVNLAGNRFGRARGRRVPGHMNGIESKYALVLEVRKRAGEIQRYDFEPEKLRLADRTYYTPDFRIVAADGTIEMHELKAEWSTGKAGWTDDGWVKFKIASELHPYRFIAVTSSKQGWKIEPLEGRE